MRSRYNDHRCHEGGEERLSSTCDDSVCGEVASGGDQVTPGGPALLGGDLNGPAGPGAARQRFHVSGIESYRSSYWVLGKTPNPKP